MARPLRIEYPGAVYHVTSRGNARRKIYLDDDDRAFFLTTLSGVVKHYGWLCHAYCLMDNHYHLLLETPKPNLSRGMRQLNGLYTQGFNRRHKKVGHLFQGRYKAILVERDSYLLELARYLVLNPVRAKIVTSPQRYRWSSYRATLGTAPVPVALTIRWVLDQFGGSKATARKRYGEFVEAGIGQSSPWKELKGQALLGSEKFVKRLIPQLQEQASSREIPKRQRLLHRPSLDKLLAGVKTKAARNKALVRAYRDYDYTLAEIGRETALHYASVSRIIKKVEDEIS